MKGLSIQEMADMEGLPYKTMAQRILRGKHKPLFSGKLYSIEVYKAVKKAVRGKPKKKD